MPVTMLNPGEKGIIKTITGDAKIRSHLAELGFVVDSEVTVVSKMGKNVILQVKDSRLALSENMAKRIFV